MTESCFALEELEGGVAHLAMSRPQALNTMTRAWWGELLEIVDRLSCDGKTRVVVLSGQGKHFSAGMDLANFAPPEGGPPSQDRGRMAEVGVRQIMDLQDSISSLEKARMPVIAAIQGACVGGAVDLVTACDLRVCTADAFFCVQEINIGITADVGTLQRLPRVVPPGIARQWCYTGERVPAARAYEVGLVNQVYDSQEAMLEGALQLARTIASKSPLAVAGTKRAINYSLDHTVAEGLEYIAMWNSAAISPADLQAGMQSLASKQDGDYEGLVQQRKYWEGAGDVSGAA